MPLPVALRDVVDELETSDDALRSYINPKTGELASVTEDPRYSAESEEPSDGWHDWEVQEWETTRRVLNTPEFIALPSKFEIHEWSIMKRFAQSLENEDHCDTLLDAIHGRGAFGRFERATQRLGVRERWYKFRSNALAEIAIEFLEENGIPYTRD